MLGLLSRTVGRIPPGGVPPRVVAPTVFVAVNAVVFCLVRPDVPDLWAARARAAAVADGVGVTYWFSWFGGMTPGGYSVMTPLVSALVGAEVVAAVAAVGICGVATSLLRGTPRPAAASWAVAGGVAINLWCGRVPFLLGGVFAVASLLMVRGRRPVPAGILAVLSVLASPVSGAFLGLAVSGVLLTRRMRDYRAAALVAAAGAFATLVLIAVVFGAPGPQPFPAYLLGETGLAIVLMLLIAPSSHVRTTLIASAVAALVVFSIPNGLGANFVRLALFCLPAAAIALSRRRLPTLVALSAPILVLGALTSVSAARSAASPAAHAAYYADLAAELETRPRLDEHRLELVSASWAGYSALTDHAMLARGWETQSFHALDAELVSRSLDATTYRRWLDENAVGYVAVDTSRPPSREARLVASGLDYLRPVWSRDGWRLYAVRRPTPIVGPPGHLEAWSQAELRIRVPHPGRTLVRVRWSRFLVAAPVEDADRPTLEPDPGGWTILTAEHPGTYVLEGLLWAGLTPSATSGSGAAPGP